MVDITPVLHQEDLAAVVVLHQLMELQELNQDKLTQVGTHTEITAVLVEIVPGQAAEAAAQVVMEVLLLVAIMVDLEVREEDSLKFLQHLVITVFSVAEAAVAVMVKLVVTELVDLVVVDKVVVMKHRLLWM